MNIERQIYSIFESLPGLIDWDVLDHQTVVFEFRSDINPENIKCKFINVFDKVEFDYLEKSSKWIFKCVRTQPNLSIV